MKKVFFLSGMPRAGNTLLGSILNQNSNIATTANSIVFDMIHTIYSFKHDNPTFLNFPDHKSHDNVIKNIIPNYFKDWKQKYIINRDLIDEGRLNLLKKYYSSDIKVIILWRDLFEVLASFIKWSEQEKDNVIFKNCHTKEDKIDILLDHETSNILNSIHCVKQMSKLENIKNVHFISYENLVNQTEIEIKKIYQFLEIPYFEHYFTNLDTFSVNGVKYIDEKLHGKNLHTIKTKEIKKEEYDYMSYIPQSCIKKIRKLNYKPEILEDNT